MFGRSDPQRELLEADQFCGHLVDPDSIFGRLAQVRDRLFSDEDFADMYHPSRGRYSIPPVLIANAMLLQAFFGVSDREAMDRVRRDIGWKVALGLTLDDEGFDPTVLCYFRERLRKSERPRRIFERFKEIAAEAGLLKKKDVRVLDSTPILSAVQTEDTVSLIRGTIRRLLGVLEKSAPELRGRILSVLERSDYGQVSKPAIDWDDQEARAALVDELVRDALAVVTVLNGEQLDPVARELAERLAVVADQDVEVDHATGRFRIRRGVARDRIISTVDPDARHGRKTRRAPFDGYKGHIAVEPESEIITEAEAAPANVPDMAVVPDIVPELGQEGAEVTVVGDTAYGSGPARQAFDDVEATVTLIAKAPPERNAFGGFPKSAFRIDLTQNTAACPAGVTTSASRQRNGFTRFQFPATVCAACPLRAMCTASERGRTVTAGPHEHLLSAARTFQHTETFKTAYRNQRTVVERLIYRITRRGGRKARYRGRLRVGEQLRMKAAVENFATMAGKGLHWTGSGGWAVA